MSECTVHTRAASLAMKSLNRLLFRYCYALPERHPAAYPSILYQKRGCGPVRRIDDSKSTFRPATICCPSVESGVVQIQSDVNEALAPHP